MARLIKGWEDLAMVEPSDKYYLDITPESGNGWVMNKDTGESERYLSTHTFYGLNHEISTKKLQEYGFDVVIANWDA
jgi:negative regulator of genetic competence, sporulation and motility